MQKRIFLHLLSALCLATGLVAWTLYASRGAAAEAPPSDIRTSESSDQLVAARIRVGRSDEAGINFRLETPAATASNGRASVAGLEQRIQSPGSPTLPYYATYIALPPGAGAEVSVTEGRISSASVGYLAPAIEAAPTPEYIPGLPDDSDAASGMGPGIPRQIAKPDPALYARDGLYPTSAWFVSEPMYFRDLRLVELRLYPLRYNPVRGQLTQAGQMDVQVRFTGAQPAQPRAAQSRNDAYVQTISEQVLNFEEATGWRALPPSLMAAPGTLLPTGVDTYKIAVDQDGIYEISGAELAAAGMTISQVDPAGLEMMYRGNPVAYQFIGDSDAILEPAEKIRFYGWAFDGPRAEKQFVSENIYWLWAGGSPTRVMTESNLAGSGYPTTTTFQSSVTREPENHFFATWTLWDGFPNEPDAWYWDYIAKGNAPLTRTYAITLPYPAQSGPDASLVAELSSRQELLPPSPPHLVLGFLNDDPGYGTVSWYGLANVNLSHSVPMTRLVAGRNDVKLVYATAMVERLYLNRITVDYTRRLVATNDQLIFTDDGAGGKAFEVSGLGQGDANQMLAWDVTVPELPRAISLDASHVVGGSGTFTYTVGISRPVPGSRFILTTLGNTLPVNRISRYQPPDLNPPGNTADWLAITHVDFMTEALRLASHRGDFAYGGHVTHVVDVEDIINQYGYGLPLPAAIHDYLAFGLGHWVRAPGYVVLVGDATQNPRQLDCPLTSDIPQGGCFAWDKDEPTYVLTDLVFKDRFQGLIPSDLTFVLLSGIDVLPDMAIGRLPVQTLAEAKAVVDKIITFELNQFTPEAWQQGMMFVADNTDSGGNFCSANLATGSLLPGSLQQTHLCLNPSGPISTTSMLRPLMASEINGQGISVLNYRGHGAVETWASELILTTSSTGFWDNAGKPVVILSADCLDGHFAWPGAQGLGETFLTLAGDGSAAHWSSSGLGFTTEHSVLHRGFYEGVFGAGLTAIGDAVDFAKLVYFSGGYHESELYSFVLEGDPAMRLFRPDLSLSKRATRPVAYPGKQLQFVLTVGNDGVYPTRAKVTDMLPTSLRFVTATATQPMTYRLVGDEVTFDLLTPLPWGATAKITLTASVSTGFLGSATNEAEATNSGANLSGSTVLYASDTISVEEEPDMLFLPVVSKP